MTRFTKLSHTGIELPDDADFAAVGAIRVNATGLLVAPLLPNDGEPLPWTKAIAGAAKIAVLGHFARAATVEEAFLVMDRSRFDPAVDPVFFPFLAEAKTWRLWTDTKSAWAESDAWYVSLSIGYSGALHQDYKGLVLAVRTVPPKEKHDG